MSEQITFATSDFASNPEPRCPCILLLDVSGSMNGRPINELNSVIHPEDLFIKLTERQTESTD